MRLMAAKKPKKEQPTEADRHKTPKLQFHLPPELRAAVQEYQNRTKPRPTYTSILILALERLLEAEGLLPTDDDA